MSMSVIAGVWHGFAEIDVLSRRELKVQAPIEKVTKNERKTGSIWEAWGSLVPPLGAQGVTFAAPYCKKSSQECSKDEFGGILKIVLFPCVSHVFRGQQVPMDVQMTP